MWKQILLMQGATGLAALFAPLSDEEAREWIADTAERKFKVLRRKGHRSFRRLQDAIAEGEEKVTGFEKWQESG
jgi:hypothetical protein